MIKNEQLKAAIDDIMDCIAAGDGGCKLVRFLASLNVLDEKSKAGDVAAGQILEVVYKFQRLVNAISR